MTAPDESKRQGDRHGTGWRRFLSALDKDPQEAIGKLARLRTKLIRYFEAHQCVFADDLADEVIDRILRHLQKADDITNVDSFALGTARLLRQEELRRQSRARGVVAELTRLRAGGEGPNPALQCFEKCLGALESKRRNLILRYYHGDARERIVNRQELANDLGLDAASLRNRALRVRRALEKCVRHCMQVSVTDSATGTPTYESVEGFDEHD